MRPSPPRLRRGYRIGGEATGAQAALTFCPGRRGVWHPSLAALQSPSRSRSTFNLRTRIFDFRGFDSSRILIVRGGILMSMGNFPESLSQGILVGYSSR